MGVKMLLPRLVRRFVFASTNGTARMNAIPTTTMTRMIRFQHDEKGGLLHTSKTSTNTNTSANSNTNTNSITNTNANTNTYTEEVSDTELNATRLTDASSMLRAVAKVSAVFVGTSSKSITETQTPTPSNTLPAFDDVMMKVSTRATTTTPTPTTTTTTPNTTANIGDDVLGHTSAPTATATTTTSTRQVSSTTSAALPPPTPVSSSASPSSSPSSSSSSSPPRLHTPRERKQLSSRAQEVAVPASRFARALQFGSLAAGLGANMLGRYSKRTLGLNTADDDNDSSMFSDASADMIVNTLCRVRGAALKLGQMISIQDEGVLPPQLAKIFDRVREGADFMPTHQLEQQMTSQLGTDWKTKFAEFEMRPFAAASIGQVHRAVLHDGREVAVKIQYPGVAESIDSDISNLMMVLNGTGLLPKGLYIDNVLAATKIELRQECDYVREASCCIKFKELLQDVPNVETLTVVPEISTERVLTTEMLYGVTLEKLQEADQETRDLVSKTIFHVTLLEIFIFRMMQTDPNWGNFLYNPETRQLQLLDFGATIEYSKEFVAGYIEIFHAASIGDHQKCLSESIKLGFLSGYEDEEMHLAHVKAVMSLGRPLAIDTAFDFGSQDVTQDVRSQIPIMLKHREQAPPTETYSLHRKLSGTFLICTRLRANIACRSLFTKIYETYHLDNTPSST